MLLNMKCVNTSLLNNSGILHQITCKLRELLNDNDFLQMQSVQTLVLIPNRDQLRKIQGFQFNENRTHEPAILVRRCQLSVGTSSYGIQWILALNLTLILNLNLNPILTACGFTISHKMKYLRTEPRRPLAERVMSSHEKQLMVMPVNMCTGHIKNNIDIYT